MEADVRMTFTRKITSRTFRIPSAPTLTTSGEDIMRVMDRSASGVTSSKAVRLRCSACHYFELTYITAVGFSSVRRSLDAGV